MAYEVLARKWRPKHFDDVIGQEHVTNTLRHAIKSGRIAHAYLFIGPRGIGKTTLSRIFAKALNCSHSDLPTSSPCDECDNCKEIMAGTSFDVIEIDAASNNGVDNIRDLRETIKFAPTKCRFKVYIIDEVHMLSSGAFNALLKTLEEPPPHAKFILATTEADKLPATIISRCQRFDLRRIPTSKIIETLSRICESEGAKVSEDALLAIARGAEGGMRDALSALDQIISFKGTDITEADVISIFGLVSRKQIEDLSLSMLSGDMATGLRIIDQLDKSGKDLRRLVIELLDHFRNILVRQQLGDDAQTMLDVTPEQFKGIDAQAKLVDMARILRIAEHFSDLEGRIRYALSRRTIFETVFLRCCRAATVVTLDQVIQKLAAAPQSKIQGETPAATVAAAPAVNTAAQAQTATGERPQPAPVQAVSEPKAAAPFFQPSKLKAALGNFASAPAPIANPTPPPQDQESDANSAASAPSPVTDAGEQSEVREKDFNAELEESPIRAAHEPAIKEALKLFKGSITEIRSPMQTFAQVEANDDDVPVDYGTESEFDSNETP